MTSTTAAMNVDPFVRTQLKMCECLTYSDLFKGYTEEKFRNLTHSALNKLPLEDESKDKISERLSDLKVEARMNSQLSSSSLPSSTPVKTENQIKQEPTNNEDLYALDENDDDVEFLCVKTKDQINSQMEVVVAQNQSCHPEQDMTLTPQQQAATSTDVREEDMRDINTNNCSSSSSNNGSGLESSHATKAREKEDELQSCCTKRKSQGETKHAVRCPKMRHLRRESFWPEFAAFIKTQQTKESKDALERKPSRFEKVEWTPNAKGAISIRAFSNMTKSTIASSSLKKQFKMKKLLYKLNLPDNLDQLSKQCDLTMNSSVELSEILTLIFTMATNLKELTFNFNGVDDLNVFLDSLVGIPGNNFRKLHLTWKSSAANNASAAITQEELQKLAVLAQTYFHGIEILIINCNIQIKDNSDQALNLLLHRLADSLKELKVIKGFIGLGSQINVFEIIVPEMQNLEKLDISSKYEVRSSEAKEPEIIDLEQEESNYEEKLIDIPVLVNFIGEKYEKLKCLRLGCKIDVSLSLDNFPALEEFVVGSAWNLRNIFDNSDHQYKLKYVQFPDALADPTIFQQVKSACPVVTRVKLQLPTVVCLQEFFNTFANSKLERLSLTFDFIFEAGLICPLKGIPFKLTSETDKAKMAKLKEYSKWPKFVQDNRIDIPPPTSEEEAEEEKEKLVGQKNFGLRNLKSLKVLTLKHYSRKLKYPQEQQQLGVNGSVQVQGKSQVLSFDQFPVGKEFYEELTKLVVEFRVLDDFGMRINLFADPKAEEEFYKKTGFESTPYEMKSRPNKISSAELISRKTEVKHEKDG